MGGYHPPFSRIHQLSSVFIFESGFAIVFPKTVKVYYDYDPILRDTGTSISLDWLALCIPGSTATNVARSKAHEAHHKSLLMFQQIDTSPTSRVLFKVLLRTEATGRCSESRSRDRAFRVRSDSLAAEDGRTATPRLLCREGHSNRSLHFSQSPVVFLAIASAIIDFFKCGLHGYLATRLAYLLRADHNVHYVRLDPARIFRQEVRTPRPMGW